MSDPIEHFRLAIAAAGLQAPDSINPDGAIHRFSTSGRRGDDSGWYMLHTDGIAAGAFGCWRSGLKSDWCAKSDKAMTDAEREAHRQRIKAMKAQREADTLATQLQASETAAALWQQATPATAAHEYLIRKGIQSHGVKCDGQRLIVPMRDTAGTLHSLQTIAPDGDKRFMTGGRVKGCYHSIGKPAGVLIVCEGLATGASIYECTGDAVAVAFNAGNLEPVAAALRAKYPSLKIIIAADDDHLADGNPGMNKATAAAQAVGGLLAVPLFPVGRPDKATDFNDLHQLAGADAVKTCIDNAIKSIAASADNEWATVHIDTWPEPKVHPLARYVDIDAKAKPPRWVIPGFVGHGVTVIAGAHGVGKTTALLPLAMTAAGLHGDDLMPRHWRHVCYVTEDVEQARRILAGIVLHSNLGISLDQVRERLHIVEAVRLDPAFVASVGATYREQFTQTVEGVEVLPLVVLDTKSAVLAIENENDNSEASSMMAALKQGFDGLPVWLIGHVAKANLSRNDALTSRGASAIEGDANQTMFLIREGESRYLVQGKTRFEAKWPELEITSYTAQTTEPDEFGNLEPVLLRWGIAAPANQSRKEAAEQASESQRKGDEAGLRLDIRDAVQLAWEAGNPLNRAGVKAKVRRKAADVVAMLENLLNERWLYEVTVPAKERTNNSKSAFLVNLTNEEHEAILSGAALPTDKLDIPASWKKEPIPVVPAPEGELGEDDHA